MQTDRPQPLADDTVDRSRRRLLIVSNRGPVEHYVDGAGRLSKRLAGGGVSTALTCVASRMPTTWIASAISTADRAAAADHSCLALGGGKRLRLVSHDPDAYELFYATFCNPILWFLQHSLWGRLQRPELARQVAQAWERGYLPVNEAFAAAVDDELRLGAGPARVMLHDYHLYVAPLFIRDRHPGAALQHFIHIPWPRPHAWTVLPRQIVESICEGLLANDSVVFQTESSAHNFLLTCAAFLEDAGICYASRTVARNGRRTLVRANPISVDVSDLRACVSSPEGIAYRDALARQVGERTIVRVDRLDPSKNIAGGFRAFERLLQRHPEWIGRVKFLAFLIPSRTSIPEYRSCAGEVFDVIRAVNERYGQPHWTPVAVFHEHNRPQALAALTLYDVLLVNPLADGMNLVSKEGPVLNRRDGVLVLSTAAGSYVELREGALPVWPEDIERTAEALHAALCLPPAERRTRADRLRRAVLEHDLDHWLGLLLDDLLGIECPDAAPVADQGTLGTIASRTPPAPTNSLHTKELEHSSPSSR